MQPGTLTSLCDALLLHTHIYIHAIHAHLLRDILMFGMLMFSTSPPPPPPLAYMHGTHLLHTDCTLHVTVCLLQYTRTTVLEQIQLSYRPPSCAAGASAGHLHCINCSQCCRRRTTEEGKSISSSSSSCLVFVKPGGRARSLPLPLPLSLSLSRVSVSVSVSVFVSIFLIVLTSYY